MFHCSGYGMAIVCNISEMLYQRFSEHPGNSFSKSSPFSLRLSTLVSKCSRSDSTSAIVIQKSADTIRYKNPSETQLFLCHQCSISHLSDLSRIFGFVTNQAREHHKHTLNVDGRAKLFEVNVSSIFYFIRFLCKEYRI